MNRFIICLLFFVSLNSYAKNPVILLSIDGFSHNYLAQYKPENLLSLGESGVMAKGLIPVFPSKTFPNHLSLVTGMYPANHGIVHNKFYNRQLGEKYSLGAGKKNPAWLTAKPIWTLAEQQGVKTAVYFWPESETKVDGILPSYYYPYKHDEPNINRVNQIVDWLKLPPKERPQLIVGYYSTIDDAGHRFGPNSTEIAKEIKKIDDLLGILIKKVNIETDVTPNIILVSDHGMTSIDQQKTVPWKSLLSGFSEIKIINGQTQLYIYEQDLNKLNDVRSHVSKISNQYQLDIFNKNNYPKHWHFNIDSAVVPDMVINARPGVIFVDEKSHLGAATHGYDAQDNDDLKAIFIAQGPDLKSNLSVDSFENIHVFSLLETLLGLRPSTTTNSDVKVLSHIINHRKGVNSESEIKYLEK